MTLQLQFYHLKNANKISDDPSSQICRDQMTHEMDFVNSKKTIVIAIFIVLVYLLLNYDRNGHSEKYKFVLKNVIIVFIYNYYLLTTLHAI